MIKIKRNPYYFLISFVVTSCVIYGSLGVCAAYENISAVTGGQNKRAVEINGSGIRILDFEFYIK